MKTNEHLVQPPGLSGTEIERNAHLLIKKSEKKNVITDTYEVAVQCLNVETFLNK